MNEQSQPMEGKDRLTGVLLSFENWEFYFIERKNILSLYIDGLKTALELQEDGTMAKQHRCKTLAMALRYREINGEKTYAMAPSGGRAGLADRIVHFKDISGVSLQYDSGRQMDIDVPWNFRSDTYNDDMLAKRDQKRNRLSLLISHDQHLLQGEWNWMTDYGD